MLKNKKIIPLVLFVIAICSLFFGVNPKNCYASEITIYTNEASFLANASIFSTEDFDSFEESTELGIGSFELDGVTYTADDPEAVWIVSNPRMPFGSKGVLTNEARVPISLSFGPENYSTAIGFLLTNASFIPSGGSELLIEVEDTRGQIIQEQFSLVQESNNGQEYRGFTSPHGILSVSVRSWPADGGPSHFNFDNVSHSIIIPEPSSNLLAIIGLASLVAFGRKRK